MNLSLILNAYRRKNNLSQKQLAVKLKCSPAFVSQLLSGERKRTGIETAKRYSAHLEGQITVNEFLGLSGYHIQSQPKNSIIKRIREKLFTRASTHP